MSASVRLRFKFTLLGTAEEQVKANWAHWIAQALFLAAFVALIDYLFPGFIPFKFWELWQTKGTVGEWLVVSWPILVWAGGLTFLVAAFTKNSRYENTHAEEYLQRGLWLSLRAGVMEEIVFRWLMFMLCTFSVQVADYIFGGFIFTHGWIWLVNEYLLIPLADFATCGILHNVLTNASTWYIAAALLLANARFRDGHKYQGLIGVINSWVIGMYMFWLMFTYGLVAAIVVHFTYDALIFGIRFVDRVIERSNSR